MGEMKTEINDSMTANMKVWRNEEDKDLKDFNNMIDQQKEEGKGAEKGGSG